MAPCLGGWWPCLAYYTGSTRYLCHLLGLTTPISASVQQLLAHPAGQTLPDQVQLELLCLVPDGLPQGGSGRKQEVLAAVDESKVRMSAGLGSCVC